MKKTTAIWAVACLALTSCYETELIDANDVTFHLSVEGLTQEQLTRAGETPELKTPTNILVLDLHAGRVTPTVKSSLAAVTMPLQYGVHDLYFVASPVAWSSYSADNLTVTWPNDGSMTAVWAYHYQIEVDEETSFEDIELPLVVADVRVKTLDKMPANTAVALIEAPDVRSTLDLETMRAVASSDGFTRQIDVSGRAGAYGFTSNIYTFVPSSGKVGDISITFYSDQQKTAEIATRTLSAVPVTAGYVSNYSGYFFSDGISIPISYTTDWLGTYEFSY